MFQPMEEISVREAAELLRVSEKTIYRWLRQGVIPSFRFQGQYRFDRKELEAWARHKRIGSGTAMHLAKGDDEAADLYSALKRGGIHYKIEGDTPSDIYRNIVEFIPFSPGISSSLRESLVSTLIERETLASTGIGQGIAVPPPRHPQDWGLGEPLVAVFFLDHPVDFQALDGKPVYVLFVLLCATVKGHLRMLAQVSHLLNNAAMQSYLGTTPNRTELFERIQHALSE